MDSVFAYFPEPNNPFVLFGPGHLMTLALLAVLGFLLIRLGMRGDESVKRRIRVGMAFFFLFWEIEWQIWHLVHGVWTPQLNLPLHMCSILIWVSMYGLFFEDRRVYSLMYFFGIAGAVQALITPNAIESFPHIRYLSTMVTHSLLVTCGFWVVFVEKYRPGFRSGAKAFLGLNVFALLVYGINRAIGSNYLYLVAKPSVATLMDYFPPWPWYILVLESLLMIIMVGMCLPFIKKT